MKIQVKQLQHNLLYAHNGKVSRCQQSTFLRSANRGADEQFQHDTVHGTGVYYTHQHIKSANAKSPALIYPDTTSSAYTCKCTTEHQIGATGIMTEYDIRI